jgi:flagellar basal-body rod protein FlgC
MVEAISAREIAVSGLRAQRTRMNVIANNIANVLTTRTPGDGGAFRRQLTVLRGYPLRDGQSADKQGVQVKRVVSDTSPLRQVFDPSHPDADPDGYVHYPNINMAAEMVDLISAQRAYEANIAVLASGSRMQQRALDMLQA